jgi:hypothetical protein
MLLLLSTVLFASEPALTLPPQQECIEALFADDPEFAVFEGLSIEQISDSMDAFIPNLHACVPAGTSLRGVAELQIEVSCDGRVGAVQVEAAENLPDSVIACVTESLRYASFPAHDTPEGVHFLYPMRFRF